MYAENVAVPLGSAYLQCHGKMDDAARNMQDERQPPTWVSAGAGTNLAGPKLVHAGFLQGHCFDCWFVAWCAHGS